MNTQQTSTQIDILLYDKSKPILFQDGDFVLITSDSFKGAIEVKTKFWQFNQLRRAFSKLSDISQFVMPSYRSREKRFFGLFSYDDPHFRTDQVLDILHNCVNGDPSRIINCISLGRDFFIRYWPSQPNSPGILNYRRWHSYQLKNKAPSYFIHNVIEHLCDPWTGTNNEVWYPEDVKENFKLVILV